MTRSVWVDPATAAYAREALSFPGLRIVLRVDHETRTPDGQRTRETRYFGTSLDPGSVTPRELLALVRSHWSVENQLTSSRTGGGMRTGTTPPVQGWPSGSRPS